MLCVNTTSSIYQWHLKQTFPYWALFRSVANFALCVRIPRDQDRFEHELSNATARTVLWSCWCTEQKAHRCYSRLSPPRADTDISCQQSSQEVINFAHGTCTRNSCLAHKAFQKSKWSSKITPSYRLHCQIHFQILPTPQSHPNQPTSFKRKHLVSCFQRKHASVNKTKPTKLFMN